jgi:hypothetical protein
VTTVDEALRAELLRRVGKDQVARKARDVDGMRAADDENLPWLKAVVADRGWPGASLVGADGANGAWLLAQHADSDPAFQRQCLGLLAAAVEAGEATAQQLAYLTDRVLLAEGKQQEYGTQVTARGGRWMPRNLRDPDGVDTRRAGVGLGTIAEYLTHFTDPPEQPHLDCRECGGRVPWEMPDDLSQPLTVACPACGRETTLRFSR